MKSAKQNTIRQRIDQKLIESKQHFTKLVLNKARHADDGYKRMDLRGIGKLTVNVK